MTTNLNSLVTDIRACTLCEAQLPHGVRPVVQVNTKAKILIAGQAPGRRVHASGIPFDDPSGVRLRDWMGVTPKQFYNPDLFAIVPMGFCYPGTGKSGDLPPRPECAATWRARLLQQLPNIETTLVIGKYAQDYHFGKGHPTLTGLVKDWQSHWPNRLPLPHPNPRNNLWLKKNPWFETEVVPVMREHVGLLIKS